MVPRTILIVDDFAAFRRFLSSLLQQESELRIVGEASDGLAAVQLAGELQPDLILLDVGLPRLNGVEAARQIRKVSPASRILFVSHESSEELIGETARLGAKGYIHKSRILDSLLVAIDKIFAGEQFISTGPELQREQLARPPLRHEVQFYSADSVLLDAFTRFLAGPLKAGNPAVVLATNSHREKLVERLKAEDVEIETLLKHGTFVALDANNTLAAVRKNGRPDPAKFFEYVCGYVRATAQAASLERPRVAVCDECVGLLCADGHVDAALEIERTGNHRYGSADSVEALCAYPLTAFSAPDDESFKSVCAEHTAIHT